MFDYLAALDPSSDSKLEDLITMKLAIDGCPKPRGFIFYAPKQGTSTIDDMEGDEGISLVRRVANEMPMGLVIAFRGLKAPRCIEGVVFYAKTSDTHLYQGTLRLGPKKGFA